MKRKLKWIFATLLTAVVMYVTMTPMGALRLAVLHHGYPLKALVLELRDTPHKMGLEENQIGYSLIDPPFEKDTQAKLVNWVVTKQGPFYVGDYYGWG